MTQRFETKILDSKNVGDIRQDVAEYLKQETDNVTRKTCFVVERIRNQVVESRKTFANETAARSYYNS